MIWKAALFKALIKAMPNVSIWEMDFKNKVHKCCC